MSAKNIYKTLAIVLGYGLIIGGFIVFGEKLETKVLVLDIVASCLIFTQFAEFTLFPLINLGNPAHKEAGMMGIHLTTLNICSLLSIGVMIYGIAYGVPFKFQLMGQLVVLFILLIGRMVTLHAGEKVQQVYQKEQVLLDGKATMQSMMDDFADDLNAVDGLDATAKEKLCAIRESIRFVSPSANPEARRFENQFCETLEGLRILMRNAKMNQQSIDSEIQHLERILSRRKKY